MKSVCRCVTAAFCLVLCFFVLVSCSSKVLVGRWETEIESEMGKITMVYHFTEKGEIFLEQKQGDEIPFSIPFGTYSVSGNELTIVSDDGSRSDYFYRLEGSLLTLETTDEEALRFSKID